MNDVRVIGAGLSGLATAWYLTEAGRRVHVIEAAARPGGLIQTIQTKDGIVETAARAFTSSERATALFAAAGVTPCPTRAESKRRYIFRDGEPRRWPLTPIETVGTVARAASAWVGRGMKPRGDETVAAWGTRVLGPAATTWLLGPALQGIYATPPDQLAAAAIFGPGRRSTRGPLFAPRGGMGELVDRLQAALVARGVTLSFGAAADAIDRSVPTVVCTNAPVAARLLAPHAPALAAAIARIRMVSIVIATAFFEPHADDWRGFGILFPRSSGIGALGVLCNTDMFPDRGTLRSETWIYGDLSPAALPTAETVVDRIAADRKIVTGRADKPVAWHVTPQIAALPVYDRAVLEAQAALSELPAGLAIAGNYLGKLGVSRLLDGAAEAALAINAFTAYN